MHYGCTKRFAWNRFLYSPLNHIYGNGYDITIGDGVSNAASGFYLYGSGQNDRSAAGVGKITAYSSNIVRIVGYVRSKPSIDVKG